MLNQPTSADALSNGDVYLQAAPFYRNEERLVSQALMVATIPENTLRALITPRNPLFPPRYGYMSYNDRQAGVEEVMAESRNYRNRRDDISGGIADIQASSRNSMGSGTW